MFTLRRAASGAQVVVAGRSSDTSVFADVYGGQQYAPLLALAVPE
jgi:hypothetical protein